MFTEPQEPKSVSEPQQCHKITTWHFVLNGSESTPLLSRKWREGSFLVEVSSYAPTNTTHR